MPIVHSSPPDGNCLFHSIANGLVRQGVHYFSITFCNNNNKRIVTVLCNYSALREACSFFAGEYPNATVNGSKLNEWIYLSSGETIDQYKRRISQDTVWGGEMEIAILSVFLPIKILVFVNMKTERGIVNEPVIYDNGTGDVYSNIRKVEIKLLYYKSSRHYDLIE